ncbi:nucleotidyltransferase family protein [Mannheimia granulomatis]|uniref:nucleotidyltransferase family protein n=1 Tax=Mannheimia granulomatis TaxID=85402 RepID=UPI00047B9691|nr:nucleotidyltransferase domain-containing protein [Mannheimia granulomatis]QLB19631.1 DNA polymerase beta subunit [Mannheimia granulomatis]
MDKVELDLQPEELAIVKSILQQFVPDYPVWAFGSRVKGTARKYSDLDLAIITEMPLTFLERDNLKEAFSESDLVWKVDIVDWATTSEAFRQIIRQKYIEIQ